jgi:hypothetical protein
MVQPSGSALSHDNPSLVIQIILTITKLFINDSNCLPSRKESELFRHFTGFMVLTANKTSVNIVTQETSQRREMQLLKWRMLRNQKSDDVTSTTLGRDAETMPRKNEINSRATHPEFREIRGTGKSSTHNIKRGITLQCGGLARQSR